MNTVTNARLRLLLGLVLLVAFLPSYAVWSQTGSSDDILPTSGREAFSREYLNSREAPGILSGKDIFDPKNKKQVDALDMEARNVLYRFTWPEVQKGFTFTTDAKGVRRIDITQTVEIHFQKFVGSLGSLANPKNATSKVVGPIFSRQIIEHANEVLTQTKKPIGQINAVRVMARLAEAPDKDPNETPERVVQRLGVIEEGKPAVINDLADALVKCIKNPNDGVKYMAFKGLIDVLKLNPPKNAELTPKTQQEIAAALSQFILQPVQFPALVSSQELEGARSLRREAIRALAGFRTPIVGDQKPALTLLKVMGNDGMAPEARSDERMEAAIGLAHMTPDQAGTYQPDYAMYQIAVFLGDLAKGIQTKTDKPHAWKVYAARLIDSLVVMRAKSNNDYVTKIAEKCIKDILLRLEEGGAAVTALPYDKFHDEIMATPSPSKSLFKGDAKATLRTDK